MGNYTVVDTCPECGSENIQVIDRYVDLDTGLTEVRHICWECDDSDLIEFMRTVFNKEIEEWKQNRIKKRRDEEE